MTEFTKQETINRLIDASRGPYPGSQMAKTLGAAIHHLQSPVTEPDAEYDALLRDEIAQRVLLSLIKAKSRMNSIFPDKLELGKFAQYSYATASAMMVERQAFSEGMGDTCSEKHPTGGDANVVGDEVSDFYMQRFATLAFAQENHLDAIELLSKLLEAGEWFAGVIELKAGTGTNFQILETEAMQILAGGRDNA